MQRNGLSDMEGDDLKTLLLKSVVFGEVTSSLCMDDDVCTQPNMQ